MNSITKLLVVGLLFMVAGCTSPLFKETKQIVRKDVAKADRIFNPSHIDIIEAPYIDAKPISIKAQPDWAGRHINIHVVDSPFARVLEQIFDGEKVNNFFDKDIDKERKVHLSFKGTIAEALERLASNVNYNVTIEHQKLIWSKLAVRNFSIGILPGVVNYALGGGEAKKSSKSSMSKSSAIGGGVGGGMVNFQSVTSTAWDKLKKILDKVISPEGSYIVSEDISNVTVIDSKNNLEVIAKVIEDINHSLLLQVGVKIQVIEISLNDEFSSGIDWSAVRTSVNTVRKFSGNFSKGIIPFTFNNSAEDTFIFDYGRSTGRYTGSSMVIKALREQGEVSIISEPRFTVLNGQVSEVKILEEEGYIKERKTSLSRSGDVIDSSIEPGIMKTGFSMYIVPTVFKDKVLLQVSTSISRNLGLRPFTDSNGVTILEQPRMSDRRFTQRSLVPNNATLVLTGFKSMTNANGNTAPFSLSSMGGQSALKRGIEIIILLTPLIVGL